MCCSLPGSALSRRAVAYDYLASSPRLQDRQYTSAVVCLQIFCIECHGAQPQLTIGGPRHHGNQFRSHDLPVGAPSPFSLAFTCLCACLQLGNRGPKADAPEYARARYLLANLGLSVSIGKLSSVLPASCVLGFNFLLAIGCD